MTNSRYFNALRQLCGVFSASIFALFLLFQPSVAGAAQTTLAWDANTQPEVAGYMLHYGTSKGTYSTKIDVGKATQRTVTGLLDGTTYYFAVTAYDLARAESGFSNEVSATTASAAPIASFTANNTSGVAPLSVQFTSTSSGSISSYAWDFGDGTTSTAPNPSHSYAAAGSYTVRLTVSGSAGSNSMSKSSYITVTTPSATAPVANFTASTTTGAAPVTVLFNSTSTGSISSYSWDFGDGTSSAAAAPSHVYTQAGTYTVSLTVTGPSGSNKITRTRFVTVSPSPSPSSVTLGATPTSIPSGGSLTVNWSGIASPSTTDWIGLYVPGASPQQFVAWLYVSCSKTAGRARASGTCVFPVPNTLAAGTYELRLHTANTYTAIAKSSAITVTTAKSSGLVAAYGFEEGAGATVSDRSGKGNNGVVSGAKWAATGRFGKALLFNGTSNWVTVADSASLDLANGMTIEAWIYPTATTTGWRTVVMKEQLGADAYYLSTNDNQPTTGVSAGGSMRQLNAGTSIAANAWTHVAATYDGLTQRLFINGAQVASRAQTGSITVSSAPLRIGGNSVWGEYFNGYIDEVKIYNQALTPAEIQADMSKAVGP